jgi:bifunctional UDP-N-acetylglucosamine pyrophosphorylase/glucosamine-1-phosphate N-acetyltransferase
MDNFVTVILAAGKGTRMESDTAKVLHPIAGLPMLTYPVRVAQTTGCEKIIVVVGHQKEQVKNAFQNQNLIFACQEEQLGSGHAVSVTEPLLKGFVGHVVILCGDVPLLTTETLQHFINGHMAAEAAVSVLSVCLKNPCGYGRIVRDTSGSLLEIVEEKDASGSHKKIEEINTGIYCCKAPFLFQALKKIGTDNSQNEYYLPDIITVAVNEGLTVQALQTENFLEVRGINDRIDLSEAEKVMRQRIVEKHMKNGVTIIDPAVTYIDTEVIIGKNTVIYPQTLVRGSVVIGENCVLEMNCSITNCVVGNRVHLKPFCVVEESSIKDDVLIGPFAHVRDGTVIESNARIGNFVEINP